MSKCPICEEETEEAYLFPMKVVTSKTLKEGKICPDCFEIIKENDLKLKISTITFPTFEEGSCSKCQRPSKYLREFGVYKVDNIKENLTGLLCPYCYASFKHQKELGSFHGEEFRKVQVM